MDLAEARKTLTDSVLHIGRTDYPVDKQDRALKFALERFLRQTRCNATVTNFTMTAASATQDVTGTFTNFMPSQVVRCRIGYKPVVQKNANEVMRKLDESTTQDRPEMIAWEAANSALVYPIPDSAYTLSLSRAAPLISWSEGTVEDVEINVPDQFVRDAIWFGASSALVYGQSGSLYASDGWKIFEDLIKEVRGQASMNKGSNWRVRPTKTVWNTEGANAPPAW